MAQQEKGTPGIGNSIGKGLVSLGNYNRSSAYLWSVKCGDGWAVRNESQGEKGRILLAGVAWIYPQVGFPNDHKAHVCQLPNTVLYIRETLSSPSIKKKSLTENKLNFPIKTNHPN